MEIGKNILQRYIDGSISDKEVPMVIEWLEESPDNMREYKTQLKLYQISIVNSKSEPKHKLKRARKIGYELLKIAAIFLIFLGGSYLYDSLNAINEDEVIAYQTLFVPAGQRAEITLPDQTKVWINSQSTLKYPIKFGKGSRQVELEGEAFFSVTKDSLNPFRVKTSSINIKVLGTEFNLKAYTEKIAEVSLLEGKVELTSSVNSKPLEMKPHEKIIYTDGKYTKEALRDLNYFRWREGLICFENESVGDILKKLELYYDIKIEAKNNDFIKATYSGKFRTKDGIEQVLKILQIEHNFNYSIDKEKNRLIIK